MLNKKWIAPILPYLAVWAGLFLFHSAWFALAGFQLGILFSYLLFRPNIPISIVFKSKNPKKVLIGALFCGASGIALYFLWGVFGIANDLPAQLSAIGLNSSSWPVFIAYFSLVNPFIEEYFWRGVFGDNSKKPTVGDIVYAGYHAVVLWGRVNPFSIVFAVILLAFAGWLWRQIAREDDGLLAPVLGHMAADFSVLLTIYLMTRR
jgi:hypothetical protein